MRRWKYRHGLISVSSLCLSATLSIQTHAPSSQNGTRTLVVSFAPSFFSFPQIVMETLSTGFRPDVYFRAGEVWEIRGAESVHLISHFAWTLGLTLPCILLTPV